MKAKSEQRDNLAWLAKLQQLSIPHSLLEEAGIDPECYEFLYHRLKHFMSPYNKPKLVINETAQLRALTGDIRCYENLDFISDNLGFNLAHYAALSGNVEALELMKKRYFNLMELKSDEGFTIAHLIVLSGNEQALEWLHKNYPFLFQVRNNRGENAAFFCGATSNIRILDWFDTNYPQLLDEVSDDGSHFLHYTAYYLSHVKEVISWIISKKSTFLSLANNSDITFIHGAAIYGGKELLDYLKGRNLNLTDVKSTTIAAYVNNIEWLQWTHDNQPKLIHQGFIIFIAIQNNNIDLLEWVYTNYKNTFHNHLKDKAILSCIEAKGSSELMNWFKERAVLDEIQYLIIGMDNVKLLSWYLYNAPALFNQISLYDEYLQQRSSISLGGFTAIKGHINSLKWIYKTCPQYLGNPQELIHAALFSHNPEVFNYALAITGNHTAFKTYEIKNDWNTCSTLYPYDYFITDNEALTISQALDLNYGLTEVKFNRYSNVSKDLKAEISAKIARNKQIQAVISEFIPLLQGAYQINSPLSILNDDARLQVLTHLLPASVDAHKVFNMATNKLSPIDLHVINLVEQEMKRLQPKQGILNFFTRLIKKDSMDKYHAFQALKTTLQEENSLEHLASWKEKYQDCIDTRRNYLHAFFSPKHKTRSSQFVENIESLIELTCNLDTRS